MICELLGANAAYVEATDGNDEITVRNDGNAITVSVNAMPQGTFPISQYQVVIVDGGEGTDSVTVHGTDAQEATQFQSDSIALRRDDVRLDGGYGVNVKRVENTTLEADDGDDLVVLRDSAGQDRLIIGPQQADLVWADGNNGVVNGLADNDDVLRAISLSDTKDELTLGAPLYTVLPLGNWEQAANGEGEGLGEGEGEASSGNGSSAAPRGAPPRVKQVDPPALGSALACPVSQAADQESGEDLLDAKAILRQLGRWKRL
jgi:hypothetical protein